MHISGRYDFKTDQNVTVSYRRGIITALDPSYAYIGGQRDLFEASWTRAGPRRHLTAFGQYEYNDRSNYYENSVLIASTSPSRFAAGLAIDSVFWDVEVSAMGAYAISIYGDKDDVSGKSRRQRRDETAEIQAKIAWRISKNTRLWMDYQFVSNRSVFSRYWYDYNRYSLAFQWSV